MTFQIKYMDEFVISRYLKLLTKTKIYNPFKGYDKELFDYIVSNIKKEITNQLKFIESIEGKDIYAIKLITSFYSLINIYNKSYIYLENEYDIEKKLQISGERYVAFRIRTPDLNSSPIYIIVSIDENRETITYSIESKNEDFTKIIVYHENNDLNIEIFTQTEAFEDIFGKKYKISNIQKEKFAHFIESNLKFLEENNKKINY